MVNPLGPIVEYLRSRPYWGRIQPAVTLVTVYLMTLVLAYEYIAWQYQLSPPPLLYARSYIVKQITLVFAAVAVIWTVIARDSRRRAAGQGRASRFVTTHGPLIARRAALVAAVLVVVVPLYVYFSPHGVRHIRVKFLNDPGSVFDRNAVVYLIYELNRRQRNWYFEVDFDLFDAAALSAEQRRRCEQPEDETILCEARAIAGGQPLIAITTQELGPDSFWQNRENVSVISTYRWNLYAPPSTYEFLTYSIIVQSLLIHLTDHCSGLPDKAFSESRVAYGDLFQYVPRRHAMKAEILAAHLTRSGEALLLNCFGAEYLATCSRLLSLDWLRSDPVKENLARSFGVQL